MYHRGYSQGNRLLDARGRGWGRRLDPLHPLVDFIVSCVGSVRRGLKNNMRLDVDRRNYYCVGEYRDPCELLINEDWRKFSIEFM